MLDVLERMVKSNRHLKEGQVASFRRTSEDDISLYIDIIKYGFLSSSRSQVSADFMEEFNRLSLDDQITVSRGDSTCSLIAVVLERIMCDGSAGSVNFSGSNSQVVADATAAINIVTRNLSGVSSDPEVLYRYFVNAEIKPAEVQRFEDAEFQALLVLRLLNEERVLFTWIVKNLIVLIQAGSLDLEKNSGFFIKIFRREKYIHGEQEKLFYIAALGCVTVFEGLIGTRLFIDPFSKQTNYSTWLNHVQKYLFLVKVTYGIEKQGALPLFANAFLKRHSYFLELYEHDRYVSTSRS